MRFTTLLPLLVLLLAVSCASPVIRSDLMREAAKDVPLTEMAKDPQTYQGRLFVLGGVIASCRLTEAGSLIEALYVPVDSNGYLLDSSQAGGRFLALYPKEQGLLDPLIYARGRRVTIAAEFKEVRPGKIDTMAYSYPFFEIKYVYLWPRLRVVRVVPYPYYGYPYPYWPYDWPYYQGYPYYPPYW